jgi:hypothetical protein
MNAGPALLHAFFTCSAMAPPIYGYSGSRYCHINPHPNLSKQRQQTSVGVHTNTFLLLIFHSVKGVTEGRI